MKEYKLCKCCNSENEVIARFCLNCGASQFSDIIREDSEVKFTEDSVKEEYEEVDEKEGFVNISGEVQRAEDFGPRKFDVVPYYIEESPALVYPQIKYKDEVIMGFYPCTVEDDEEIIAALNNIKNVNEFGYIEYQSVQYAPVLAVEKTYRGCKFSNGKEIIPGVMYYFRVEPLEWKIVLNSQLKNLLVTKYIIDYECFNNYGEFEGKLANSYLTSRIRKWLNSSFMEKTFSKDEKGKISPSVILKKDGEKIFDNVFIFGYTDILNTDLGLNLVEDRRTLLTDYAKLKGGYFLEDPSQPDCGVWCLRTPKGTKGTSISCVDIDGSICKCSYDSLSCCGIRPSITVRQ